MNTLKTQYLNYLQIAQFFIENFSKIKDLEEIKKFFDSKITDVTKEREDKYPGLVIENHQFIGQDHHDFEFYESNDYWGELSIDFISGILKNVRCQLFAEGFIPNNFGIGKKFKKLSELLSDNFGKANELDYSLVGINMPLGIKNVGWIDDKENIFFTLRSSINQPNIRNYTSFAAEYFIENHRLLIKK